MTRFLFPLLLATPLSAATYIFTGNPFNNFFGATGVTSANFITASMTLNAPLAASLPFGAISPLSWSITDGIHSLDSLMGGLNPGVFFFQTDASGNISRWNFGASTNVGPNASGLQTVGPSLAFYNDGVHSSLPFFDLYANRSVQGTTALNDVTPGTWTLQATAAPEPSSLALVLGAGGALALGRRRVMSRILNPPN